MNFKLKLRTEYLITDKPRGRTTVVAFFSFWGLQPFPKVSAIF